MVAFAVRGMSTSVRPDAVNVTVPGALAITPSEGFYDQVTKVVTQLNQDYQASSLDTSNLKSTELQQAFDEVPECR